MPHPIIEKALQPARKAKADLDERRAKFHRRSVEVRTRYQRELAAWNAAVLAGEDEPGRKPDEPPAFDFQPFADEAYRLLDTEKELLAENSDALAAAITERYATIVAEVQAIADAKLARLADEMTELLDAAGRLRSAVMGPGNGLPARRMWPADLVDLAVSGANLLVPQAPAHEQPRVTCEVV